MGSGSDRRALVTGGGGFIGTRLCRRLAADGFEVYAAGRRRPLAISPEVRARAADFGDADTARALVNDVRPDVVFHLASAVSGARALEQVLPTFRNNLMSTVALLVAATESGCDRIVLAGSMEEPHGEPDAVAPSPYAAAKWASTTYARMFHALYDSPVVVLRIFMGYGPGQIDYTKLIPYVGRCFLRDIAPRLSSGRRPVDWVYVDDVVDALVAASSAPDISGQIIDVGSGKLVTIRAVVDLLSELTGTHVAADFGALPDRPLEHAKSAATEPAQRLLGWRATTPLRDGLRQTVEWLRDQVDT
jgi:nucleoside-diphosphate-sugar epimerase